VLGGAHDGEALRARIICKAKTRGFRRQGSTRYGLTVDAVVEPGLNRGMKMSALLGLALSLAFFGTGCARYYNVITSSGRVITAKGKPRYDRENSQFVFTDVHGEVRRIPAGSVSQIAPASDTSSPTTFNAKPAR
jgi:hypothetical protein